MKTKTKSSYAMALAFNENDKYHGYRVALENNLLSFSKSTHRKLAYLEKELYIYIFSPE